jgi:hypothetical protein
VALLAFNTGADTKSMEFWMWTRMDNERMWSGEQKDQMA